MTREEFTQMVETIGRTLQTNPYQIQGQKMHFPDVYDKISYQARRGNKPQNIADNTKTD